MALAPTTGAWARARFDQGNPMHQTRRTPSHLRGKSPLARFDAVTIYCAWAGPINGVRTGLANPKKTTVVLAAKRVDSASSGTSLKPTSVWFQLLATQALPAGSRATPVMVCRPPM